MKNWFDIQRAYPFFWMWLNAWLKSKGADTVQVLNEGSNSECVKVRFYVPHKERELSDEMLNEMLDEAGIRVCINFNTEDTMPAWKYVIFKNNGIKALWTQTYDSNYIFADRKSAQRTGFLFAMKEHDESLKKQNAVEQY
jgi:hypothetical protein